MHNAPYTAKTSDDPAPEKSAPLPLRKEAPELPACDPPQKDIADTRGGKITDFIIYKVLGFAGNSSLSVGVTYWINPKQGVKDFRKSATEGAKKMFRGFVPAESVSNMMEIGFMLISGTALTACMAPLVNRRDKIAYWINKKIGKDTDILPEHLRTYNTPLTLEDKIEQELKKRVHYGQTSRDLWKARWTAILVPLIGDGYLGKISAQREAKGKWSVDTASWKVGQHLYDDVLHKETVAKASAFFTKHEAGIEDMKTKNAGTYDRLKKVEDLHEKINTEIHGKPALAGTPAQNDRMMIADQTRLLTKEVGWTLILAEIVERSTKKFQLKRIRKQEDRALAKMREEGIIPAGVSVDTDKQGHVTLTTTKSYVPTDQRALAESVAAGPAEGVDTKKWADDKVKKVVANAIEQSANHSSALEKARLTASQQTVQI